MKDYKPWIDKDTGKWAVLKKEMTPWIKLQWIVVKHGFKTKQDAQKYIETLEK